MELNKHESWKRDYKIIQSWYHKKDGFRSSGLREWLGSIMNVLSLLLLCVQEEKHGASAPGSPNIKHQEMTMP
jgi:hypothetical protein